MRRQTREGARSVVDMQTTTRSRILRRWTLDPERVLERRLEIGLRQIDLARRVGISPSHMNDIEAGRRAGSPPVRRAIAKALDVPLRDICRTP